MKTKISLEQLAERMGETVWSKGNIKRIYLNDAGWNTKKMSTKTFIFQDENGDFKVSCRIECPSQGWQWIESQENEVKERVYEKIENALCSGSENAVSEDKIEGEGERRVVTLIKEGKSLPINVVDVENFADFLEYCKEDTNFIISKIMKLSMKKAYVSCENYTYPSKPQPIIITLN